MQPKAKNYHGQKLTKRIFHGSLIPTKKHTPTQTKKPSLISIKEV